MEREVCAGVARFLTCFETGSKSALNLEHFEVICGKPHRSRALSQFQPNANLTFQRQDLTFTMIVGSGIDLIEIARIQQSIDRYGERFLDRVYTAAEKEYCLRKRKSAESLAARFAAKEAGAKALGTGISYGVHWLEIEVVREPSGRPTLKFHGRAAQIAKAIGAVRFALSLTHSGDLAMASVVLEDGR